MTHKFYKKGSKAWDIIANQVYDKSAEHVGKLLDSVDSGYKQLLIINTIKQMDRETYPGELYAEWYDKIYGSLFANVDRYGEKARKLSEKQSDIICREIEDHWTSARLVREFN